MNPYLSIIVPIYKVEPYLKQCVDSILAQTYKDFEVILVDDGSPDACSQICDTYAQKDTRVKVIHKVNGGLVSARKFGAKVAKGEYITFVDGDDWIEPKMYSSLCEHAHKNSCDIIISGFVIDDISGKTEYNNKSEAGIYTTEESRNWLYRKMIFSGVFYTPGVYPVVWNKLFKKDILLPNLLLIDEDITMGEDVACTYACLLDSKSIEICENLNFYHYRQNPQAMTKMYDARYFDRTYHLYAYLDKVVEIKRAEYIKFQLSYHKLYILFLGVMKEYSSVNKSSAKEKINKCKHVISSSVYQDVFKIKITAYDSTIPKMHRVILRLLTGKHVLLTYCIYRIWEWRSNRRSRT